MGTTFPMFKYIPTHFSLPTYDAPRYITTLCRGGKANLVLKVRKSQIRKFSGSIRIRKYANFFGMPVHKLKI
jgi:hypothetical protein